MIKTKDFMIDLLCNGAVDVADNQLGGVAHQEDAG
jgi:hypothetical protein